jgi:NAD+ diphosphatase
MADLPAYVRYPLDRDEPLRSNAARLAELRARADARLVVFWRLKPLVRVANDHASTAFDDASDLLRLHPPATGADKPPEIFLGLDDHGRGVFAVALDAALEPAEADPAAPVRFMELREATATLHADEASILGAARSLLAWHENHGFCSRCGTRSEAVHAGWRRACPSCKAEHYPRVDPVVIMLIERGDKILLGRGLPWPVNAYSCVAGFVEPGETPEQAARREAKEETGILLGDVSFLMTQPWPFPSSLMLGMRAEALTEEIRIDPAELADARWFSRAEVVEMMAGRSAIARTPFKAAVAHHLIRWWLEKG